MAAPRDVFPLRFKNPSTRAALKHLADQTGTSMNEIAERAIEHEVALQGADLERRLQDALAVVRSYRPERDLAAYVETVAAGEQSGLALLSEAGVTQDDALSAPDRRHDPLGVAAAFARR
jgi:hypothetical protein